MHGFPTEESFKKEFRSWSPEEIKDLIKRKPKYSGFKYKDESDIVKDATLDHIRWHYGKDRKSGREIIESMNSLSPDNLHNRINLSSADRKRKYEELRSNSRIDKAKKSLLRLSDPDAFKESVEEGRKQALKVLDNTKPVALDIPQNEMRRPVGFRMQGK